MTQKTIIIGMNNPLSTDPRYALFPAPEGCAGHRLWQMLQLAAPDLVRMDYINGFERMNLVTGPWSGRAGRDSAAELLRSGRLHSRRVILLGTEVWRAFSLPITVPACGTHVAGTTEFTRVPHPSGRNLWYNDINNRRRVGRLLEAHRHGD
jgi:hypothetical protein